MRYSVEESNCGTGRGLPPDENKAAARRPSCRRQKSVLPAAKDGEIDDKSGGEERHGSIDRPREQWGGELVARREISAREAYQTFSYRLQSEPVREQA